MLDLKTTINFQQKNYFHLEYAIIKNTIRSYLVPQSQFGNADMPVFPDWECTYHTDLHRQTCHMAAYHWISIILHFKDTVLARILFFKQQVCLLVGKRLTLSRLSKQDTKSFHDTESSMKHLISKGYSGFKEVISEDLHIWITGWARHLLFLKKNQHAFIDLTGHRMWSKQLCRIWFLPFTGPLA